MAAGVNDADRGRRPGRLGGGAGGLEEGLGVLGAALNPSLAALVTAVASRETPSQGAARPGR